MKKVLNVILMIAGPIATYYLMEAFTINAFVTTRVKAQLLNIVIFELIMLFLFFLTGHAVAALEIETAFFLFVGLANAYVLRFRSTPIVPWDLLSLKTALSVADNYSFALEKREVAVLVGFALLFALQALVRISVGSGEKVKARHAVGRKLLVRIAGCICSAGLLIGEIFLLSNDTFVSKAELYPFLFTPTYMSRVNGFVVTFFMDVRYLTVEKPAGYDASEAEALLEKYEIKAEQDSGKINASKTDQDTGNTDGTQNKQKSVNTENLPNIIVIMDEAFSDLSILGNFTTNTDYMPFVHSLMEGADDTISGYLNVSVKGGNTANTEYEFLTGNTMAFLPAGSIPYQQYIKGETNSLVTYLDSLGYRTVAMHPYGASGWNRNTVYPWIGFSEALFLNDFTGASYVREYVSDASDFDKLINIYESAGDEPLFLFNVTMQNHGSYGESYANFEEDIEVAGSSSEALSRYLSLIHLTDEALSELISYLDAQEEETIVVFFGDHEPNDTIAQAVYSLNGKSYKNLTDEETDNRYKVPYFIWANYDIEEETEAETSANYLASKVLEAAGIPMDGYHLYLSELSEQYPIVSARRIVSKDGTVTYDAVRESGLSDYHKLQYYLMFDKN